MKFCAALRVSQGQPLRVINYVEASPQGVTLRRAMGRLGEQDYNLLFNNCEHFATWCKPDGIAVARWTPCWSAPATGAG